LQAAGSALVINDDLTRADIVVVPEWAGEAGAIDAADIVRAGVAHRVAVLPGPFEPAERELARRRIAYDNPSARLILLLHMLGVSETELVPNLASGTEAEGDLLPAWSASRGFHSVIVVSVPDHSRRVRRVLHRSTGGGATFSVRSTRHSSFDPAAWWRTREGVRIEIVELEKLLLDVVRHPIS
jgi:hypothetical protein